LQLLHLSDFKKQLLQVFLSLQVAQREYIAEEGVNEVLKPSASLLSHPSFSRKT